MNPRGRRWVRNLIGLLITILAFWLSFRKIEWNFLAASFSRIDVFWVLLALANVVFSAYALGWRWRILLEPKERLSMRTLFRLNVLSQYVNILMPGRFGEIFRAYLGSRESTITTAFSMGTVAIEKLFDFFMFVFLWIVAPSLFAVKEHIKGSWVALMAGAILLSLLFLSIYHPDPLLRLLGSLTKILPERKRGGVRSFFEQGFEAFKVLRSSSAFLSVSGLTLLFLIGQILTNYFIFRAFHLPLSFWAATFVLLAVQAGNVPPSAPGKIGIFEYAVILALSVFGVAKSEALSYGILLHLVAFLPKIVLGMFFVGSVDLRALKKTPGTINNGAGP